MNDKAAKKHLEKALRDKVSKKISETLKEESKKLH